MVKYFSFIDRGRVLIKYKNTKKEEEEGGGGKGGVKKFLDFEYKRLCILYLSISSITFLTVALWHLQFLLTCDMWHFSQIKSRLFSYVGIKESWFVWETDLETLWWTLMENTLV